jgi:hypothetical protein
MMSVTLSALMLSFVVLIVKCCGTYHTIMEPLRAHWKSIRKIYKTTEKI